MKKRNATSDPMWKAIILGLVISALFSILGAAIGASILNAGGIGENSAIWITALNWGISVFCGTMLALKLHKENMIVTAAITAGGYMLMLTCINLLFLNQQFKGVGSSILAILAGFTAAVLLNLNIHKKKGHKTRYRPR